MNLASLKSEYNPQPLPEPQKFSNPQQSHPVIPSPARFHSEPSMDPKSRAGLYDYLKKFNTNFMLNGLGKVITSQKPKTSSEPQYQISETKQADLVQIKKILDNYWSRKSKQLLQNCSKAQQGKTQKKKLRCSYMRSALGVGVGVGLLNSVRGSSMGIGLDRGIGVGLLGWG